MRGNFHKITATERCDKLSTVAESLHLEQFMELFACCADFSVTFLQSVFPIIEMKK